MQNGSTNEATQSKQQKYTRAPLKESEKMWVTATLCLILFLVVSVQVLLIVPYFVYDMPYTPFRTIKALAQLLIPFNIGAALILINYYKCVTMDAGSVPTEWQPPSQAYTNDNEPRYCRPCKAMKPPRTHHCRTCQRCTLRMDHHCPWIANCVGQRNYASFIRFLAAVDITCAAHLVLCGMRTADYWWVRQGATWRPPSTTVMVVLVLNFCLCLPTFLLVGSFSIYHFWCLCTNTTTIEGWEKDKVETMISKRRIEEVDYPFDLGIVANIQSILGKSPLQWCIPSLTSGDGLRFVVMEGIDPLDQYHWPPKDPRRAARKDKKRATLSATGPFTYGNGNFNPALRPSNSTSLQARQTVSDYPPWHPDYNQSLDDGEEEADAAQASGVDLADSCVPPVKQSSQSRQRRRNEEEESEESNRSSSEEETATTMTRSRVRRGSEGYEVRPKRYEVAYAAFDDGDQDDPSDEQEDEKDKLGFDDYNDEAQDDREWDWKQRQEEEDKLREILEQEMRDSGPLITHDPPSDWQNPVSSSILLPSQVMRRRSQWHQYINQELEEDQS